MSSLQENLDRLGLELPPVAAPVACYVPAVQVGNLIMTSGQLPVVDGKLVGTGKVGTEAGLVTPDEAYDMAKICALNALAAAASAGADLDRDRVVKVVGFVASHSEFTGQPGVINGASELLGELLGDRGVHARSAVGVPVLPLDSPVEVEIIVERHNA